MIIGEKIKELRKKNDLTQEKLADYLCVSYQAVSKWETGVSSPDLSLIAPLTKLLRVSADELLGLNETEPDKNRTEIENAYEKTWKTGDLDERIKIAEMAINEYPGDTKYLNWLASALYFDALEHKIGKEQNEELEKVIKICEVVIEDSTNEKLHTLALQTIIQSLSWLYRYDEAKKYADLYPDASTSVTKDDMLAYCLIGEDGVKHRQKRILKLLSELEAQLAFSNDLNALRSAEQIIKLLIPDGNYLEFHASLFQNYIGQAIALTNNGRRNEAVSMLEKALYHVTEYDSIAFNKEKICKYTAPLFNLIEFDPREWVRGVSGTFSDGFNERLKSPAFDSLRDRDDFKKLLERCT